MSKMLTNRHLISLLNKQGIDSRSVELKQDYASQNGMKERSPYAQFFINAQNPNQRIMQVGMLPRITNAGFFIVPQFKQRNDKFIAEENCFGAEIDNKGQITVICINDQPNGRKKFDQAIWHPQVYLDGVEQKCGSPLWLETDHVNPNYHFNVLEYDYGFCKRRVRIIEGRFRDRITITSNPKAEVKVMNNITGNMPLKFGSYDAMGTQIGIVQNDIEIISKAELATANYPITIGASPETFYPDADAETTSVDGALRHIENEVSFATLRAGAGTAAYPSTDPVDAFVWATDDNDFDILGRSCFVYPTGTLPDVCTITNVVHSLYGTAKMDTLSDTPDIVTTSADPASIDDLVAGDFNSLGTESLSNVITYGNWDIAGYNDFTLIDVNTDGFATNADGTYISKTGPSKLGNRNKNFDIDAGSPGRTGNNQYTYLDCNCAEQGDTTKDPKLVVTYTVRVIPRHGFVNFQDPGIV